MMQERRGRSRGAKEGGHQLDMLNLAASPEKDEQVKGGLWRVCQAVLPQKACTALPLVNALILIAHQAKVSISHHDPRKIVMQHTHAKFCSNTSSRNSQLFGDQLES